MMTGGFEFYATMIRSLRGDLIVYSALLFFAGLFSAPVVVEREISPLLRYPLWIWERIQRWLRPDDSFLRMIAIITFLNASSLLANILSGLFVILPFVFACLIGLHIGVIVIKGTGRCDFMATLLNPVAFMELPATWISLSIGMDLGLFLLNDVSFSRVFLRLRQGLIVYGTLLLPVLGVAAFTEVFLIKGAQRLAEKRDEEERPRNVDS
jgi:hypothetical protein